MTVSAHKLARMVYYMVTIQRECDATIFHERTAARKTQCGRNFMVATRAVGVCFLAVAHLGFTSRIHLELT